MKRVLKAILCFICIFCIILTDTVVCYAEKDDTSSTDTEQKVGLSADDIKAWNKVQIHQGSVGHKSGCTNVSLQLVVQNSTRLQDKYQLDGLQNSSGGSYGEFNTAIGMPGDAWELGKVQTNFDNVCKNKGEWNLLSSIPKKLNGENTKEEAYNGAMSIVGLGNKDFLKMSKAEIVSCMKALWNSGYFVIFCVRYGDSSANCGNGPANHRARHATMLAGVTDKGEIYINDPANGKIRKYSEAKTSEGNYKLTYCLLLKNSEVSPMSLAGQARGVSGKASVTSKDVKSGEKLGLTVSALNGAWSEEQLSSICKLEEIDISELLPQDRSALSGGNLESLDNWETNIEAYGWKARFIDIVRVVIMMVGILFSVWVILVYVCFWFDRLNNFIDLPLLPLITLGKLEASPTDDESTFRMKDTMKKTGKKTINHRQVVWLCVVALVFGMLIISGEIFAILGKLIVTVHRILKGLS